MKKIISLNQIKNLIKQLRKENKTLVLAGGCFDLLHQGHLEYLKAAKKQGDILIVALESDQNIRRLKGNNRPVNKETVRTHNLLCTNLVDYIIILPKLPNTKDYAQLVTSVSPNIIAVTKGDPKISIKKQHAKLVSAKVKIVIDCLPGLSTTEIIKSKAGQAKL